MATHVLGFFGTQLDAPRSRDRWSRWRPTVSLFQHDDFVVDHLHLLVPQLGVADPMLADIARLSPETVVHVTSLPLADPWDFEEVYAALHDVATSLSLADDDTLLVHLTTGTHVAQICLFLLTEARFLPGELLQSGPPRRGEERPQLQRIDLDLSRYDAIAQRLLAERVRGTGLLKAGIPTRHEGFNRLMGELEVVAGASTAPILLTGPTGSGKTQLARRIYELKRQRHQLGGPMVEVNCATLRGDQAMSALFGHTKGAFTGAVGERAGLLKRADGGLIFLDEIAELGLDEQAMLLRAIEEGWFLPVGADREVRVAVQVVAGTHRDLRARVREGRFREDLLARLDVWVFALPALRERPDDVAPNVEHELERFAAATGRRVVFQRSALERYLRFATGPEGRWPGNFRDLGASVTRLATLAPAGRIDGPTVERELDRLRAAWGAAPPAADRVARLLGEGADALDRFDRVQLDDVLAVCAESRSLSEAGRALFAASRARRASTNDADRLRKYLARFELSFEDIHDALRG